MTVMMMMIVMPYDKNRDDDDNGTGGMNDMIFTSTITNIMIFHICCIYMMKY